MRAHHEATTAEALIILAGAAGTLKIAVRILLSKIRENVNRP